ncbi:MAG: hypothetical protein M3R67_13930 [Acidobacteriota bacterium]|nr:hypothetical protein [Acidobacteriota bacterium]
MTIQLVSNWLESDAAVQRRGAPEVCSWASETARFEPANQPLEVGSCPVLLYQRQVNAARTLPSRLDPRLRFLAERIELIDTRL